MHIRGGGGLTNLGSFKKKNDPSIGDHIPASSIPDLYTSIRKYQLRLLQNEITTNQIDEGWEKLVFNNRIKVRRCEFSI
ncbi:hypothetical protein Tco_1266232 [Tanacetum coccineum]